jgi:hypothetical protein
VKDKSLEAAGNVCTDAGFLLSEQILLNWRNFSFFFSGMLWDGWEEDAEMRNGRKGRSGRKKRRAGGMGKLFKEKVVCASLSTKLNSIKPSTGGTLPPGDLYPTTSSNNDLTQAVQCP